MPASSAASVNVAQVRVRSVAGTIPGSPVDFPAGIVKEAPNASLPVNRFRTSAADELKVLCPEAKAGNGGDNCASNWYGFHVAPSISLVPWPFPPHARIFWPLKRKWMAVIGRTES